MFNIWNIDDGSLGGEVDILIEDFETVRRIGSTFGLLLNEQKCELVTNDMEVVKKFRVIAPTIIHVDVSYADVLSADWQLGRNRRCSDDEDLRFPAADLQTETAMCT